MALFGSESTTKNKSVTRTEDRKVLAEAGAEVIQSEGGPVTINSVPDEAFQVTGQAISALAGVAQAAKANEAGDLARVADSAVKVAIPAIAAIWIIARFLK